MKIIKIIIIPSKAHEQRLPEQNLSSTNGSLL